MTAQLLSNFGTTFQRLLLDYIQDTPNSWHAGFGQSSISLTPTFGLGYTVTFTGSGLTRTTVGVLSGSVAGISISNFDPTIGKVSQVEISGLSIPDLGDFMRNRIASSPRRA